MKLSYGLWTSGVAGFLFAVGLGSSGMTDANNVIGFLHVTGDWNPSLALVMLGAIGVYAPIYQMYTRRYGRHPLHGGIDHVPTVTGVDKQLIIGAILFGVGWGLAGLCPGPAWVSLASFHPSAWLFVASMLGGMSVYAWIRGRPS